MRRPPPKRRRFLHPWVCPLCERGVEAVSMWREHTQNGGDSAIYFHADNERCFVANHRLVSTVSHIREIADHRENTLAETPQ